MNGLVEKLVEDAIGIWKDAHNSCDAARALRYRPDLSYETSSIILKEPLLHRRICDCFDAKTLRPCSATVYVVKAYLSLSEWIRSDCSV